MQIYFNFSTFHSDGKRLGMYSELSAMANNIPFTYNYNEKKKDEYANFSVTNYKLWYNNGQVNSVIFPTETLKAKRTRSTFRIQILQFKIQPICVIFS